MLRYNLCIISDRREKRLTLDLKTTKERNLGVWRALLHTEKVWLTELWNAFLQSVCVDSVPISEG